MKWWTGLLDVLFPRCCPMCDTLLEENEEICPACMEQLPRTEQATLRGNSTEELFSDIKRFERGGCFMFFDKASPVQQMLHQMKYSETPGIGYQLAKEAAYDFMAADFFDGIDVIIPVPLHKRRLRERGFNQSEWIAKGLSDVTGIPMDTSHILRVVNNQKQATKSGAERKANVEKIFAVSHPEEMYRKHILLVDDIITTGSTLHSCIKTMSAFRGCKVSVFALSKARKTILQ